MSSSTRPSLAVGIILACLLGRPSLLHANHGPGASGGGSSTISGETLKPQSCEITFREDFTEFEHFTPAQARQRAAEGGDFDALRRGFITSVDLAFGVMNDFQVAAIVGYFAGEGFLSASSDGGGQDVATATPTGLTDLTLTAKYRVLKGWPGNLAIIGGVKLPTGRDNVHLSNGEKISPTDQPGTGAFDFPVGVGYSRFLTSKITLDASAMYLIRKPHEDFKVGDRLDVGLAVAYRLTDSIKTFPQVSIFGEVLTVYLQKDADHGQRDPNSGSVSTYFSPGLRIRLDPHVSLTAAPLFPVYQELNGDQGKVEIKGTISLSFSF